MQRDFSVTQAAKKGFQLTFKHFGTAVIAFLSYMFIYYSGGLIAKFAGLYLGHLHSPFLISMPKFGFSLWQAKGPLELAILYKAPIAPYVVPIFLSAFFSLVNFLFAGGIFLGLTRIYFDLYDEGVSSVGRLFSSFNLLGKYIVAGLVMILLLAFPLVGASIVGMPLAFIFKSIGVVTFFVTAIFLSGMFYLLARSLFFLCYIVDKKSGGIESIKQSFYATRGHFWKLIGALLLSFLMGITIIGIPAIYFMLIDIYRKIG